MDECWTFKILLKHSGPGKLGWYWREANNMHLTMHGIKCGKKWGSTGINENLVMKYPQSGSIKLGKPRQKTEMKLSIGQVICYAEEGLGLIRSLSFETMLRASNTINNGLVWGNVETITQYFMGKSMGSNFDFPWNLDQEMPASHMDLNGPGPSIICNSFSCSFNRTHECKVWKIPMMKKKVAGG